MNIYEMIKYVWNRCNNQETEIELIKLAIEYEKIRLDKYYEALQVADKLSESEE